MKKIIFIVIFLVFIWGNAFAQTKKGDTELSFSFSYWLIKEKDNEEDVRFNFHGRVGYFITDKIEFEPELTSTIIKETDVIDLLIMGNLVYNFKIIENPVLFILAGAGYGRAINLFSSASNADTDVTAFNFGAGFKNFISPTIAIRSEYRFTHYSAERRDIGINIHNLDIHNLFIGISFFFK